MACISVYSYMYPTFIHCLCHTRMVIKTDINGFY
jgi:hypothetical protein